MKVNSEPQPLVSVVILCYNQQDYIGDAIDSVMGQTYSNIEIIISDDGSCDNSRDIIRKKVNDWKHKDRVKLFLSEENTAFACAEEALNSAVGKYICAMGGDDMMSDEKIAKQVEFLERNKGEYSLCFTWIECIGCESIKVDMMQRWFNIDNIPHSDMIRTLYLNGNIFAAPSFMMRRDLFEKLGGFDFSLRQTQDYVLWLKYIVENRAYIIPEKLTKYRVVKGSVSDAEVDKGVDIRTLEELINEIYEIVVNLEGEVFQKAFLLEDKESIDKTDMNCRKMLLFYSYAMEEMNVRAGEIAVRLYFHYRKEEGFTKLLK